MSVYDPTNDPLSAQDETSTVRTYPSDESDAGIRAAERIRERHLAAKVSDFISKALAGAFLLFIVSAGIFGWWVYEHLTKARTSVERQCSLQVGDKLITGVRQYGYTSYDILGVQYRFNDEVDEVTRVTLEGYPLMIIGYGTDKWWALPTQSGDRGKQILKPANSYTFVVGNQVNVVSYEDFCRPKPRGLDGQDAIVQSDVVK